jgi:hypothetical protein
MGSRWPAKTTALVRHGCPQERERERGETEEGQLQYPRTELGWQLGFTGWGARERRKGWQLGFALLPRGSGQ